MEGTVAQLQEIAAWTNGELIGRGAQIDAALTALVAGQHCAFIGPHGTAKSLTITKIASCFTGATTFYGLLSKTTDPNELFGPFSIPALEQERYLRVTTGRVPAAHIVFLDEWDKASTYVKNLLLTIMSERAFDNDGVRQQVPLLSLFTGTNALEEEAEQAPSWDRFGLRVHTPRITELGSLISFAVDGVRNTPQPRVPLAAILDAQQQARSLPMAEEVRVDFIDLLKECQAAAIAISERRIVWAISILRAAAFLRGGEKVEQQDFSILQHVFWTTHAELTQLQDMIEKYLDPITKRIKDMEGRLVQMMKEFRSESASSSLNVARFWVKVIALEEEFTDLEREYSSSPSWKRATAFHTQFLDCKTEITKKIKKGLQ